MTTSLYTGSISTTATTNQESKELNHSTETPSIRSPPIVLPKKPTGMQVLPKMESVGTDRAPPAVTPRRPPLEKKRKANICSSTIEK